MRPNRVKQRIREGKIALNCPSHLADPAVIELIGLAGFDSVVIDLEHDAFDLGLAQRMIVAADLVGVTSIVRIGAEDWGTAQQVLDAGAEGIQVPHVSTRSAAEAAVAATRYPPLGKRGASRASRAARYGTVPWPEHMRTSNDEVLLNVMIEDGEGLANIEEIASVEGVDLLVVGIQDLAGSLGIAQDPAALRRTIADLADRVRRAGRARLGVATGFAGLPLTLAEVRDLGAVFTTVNPSAERRLLSALTAAVAALRDDAPRDGSGRKGAAE